MAEAVRWHLELAGEVVARIDPEGYEFPWTYGRLVGSPGFEQFRRYFTDPEGWPEEDAELDALCGEVQAGGGFVLRELPAGVAYRGVCLNHDGGEGVWFRHGDPI
jgi:hypothetical protein